MDMSPIGNCGFFWKSVPRNQGQNGAALADKRALKAPQPRQGCYVALKSNESLSSKGQNSGSFCKYVDYQSTTTPKRDNV